MNLIAAADQRRKGRKGNTVAMVETEKSEKGGGLAMVAEKAHLDILRSASLDISRSAC